MARAPLTKEKIDGFKPKAKPYKKSDGGGLHLLMTPAGGKHWRLSYRHDKKQKTLVLGSYDADTNGLTQARARREAAKLALKAGRDPGRTNPATDGQATFQQVATQWHADSKSAWDEKYARLIWTRLEDDIFPVIGAMPIGAITKADVRAALVKVAGPREEGGRGAIETAHRLKKYVSAIFAHCDDDNLEDVAALVKLPKRPKVKHFKRVNPLEIGALLLKVENAACEPLTRSALLFTMLTAARTANVIEARWSEIERLNLTSQAQWRIPGSQMKGEDRPDHVVPLSKQAVAILRELYADRGRSDYIFPATDGKKGHMSNNTMLYALYDMGYRNKSTVHGFRSNFSTYAHESKLWPSAVIEHCLAHIVGSKVSRSYNEADYRVSRRDVMQWWADELDSLKKRTRQDRRMFA